MSHAPTKTRVKNRATLQSIADTAGVSVGAVSSVLNNRQVERRISAAAVDRIRAAIVKLGYLPNIDARRLRRGVGRKNNVVIGFVTSYEAPLGLVNQLILELRESVLGAEVAATGITFSVMMEMFSAGHLRDLPGLLTGDHFNAVIITNTTPPDDQFLNRCFLPYPAVLVNRVIPGYTCVVEDQNAGGQVAGLFLAAKRRRLAVLIGTPLTQMTRERVDSFVRTVVSQTGIAPVEIVADTLSETSAYTAMARFSESGELVNGLYCISDSMASGAYRAIKERKLRIPEDVAVIGVGDYDISNFFDPPLTVVGVNRNDFGRAVSRALLQKVLDPSLPGSKVEVPVHAVVRASTPD